MPIVSNETLGEGGLPVAQVNAIGISGPIKIACQRCGGPAHWIREFTDPEGLLSGYSITCTCCEKARGERDV